MGNKLQRKRMADRGIDLYNAATPGSSVDALVRLSVCGMGVSSRHGYEGKSPEGASELANGQTLNSDPLHRKLVS
jgi:hypothetical protein